MTEQLNYAALNELIDHENWWFRAAELHGILTFLVAGKQQQAIFSLLKPPTVLAETTISRLTTYIDRSLAATDLTFRLLLPVDCPPAQRAEALIEWVEGFLLGKRFLSSITFDENCEAFLTDLTEIAKLDPNLEPSEENARLLNDLEEHCRLGALLLYATTHTGEFHDQPNL